MEQKPERFNRSLLYAATGFIMGIAAPLIWIAIRLLFFVDHDQPMLSQIFADITKDAQNLALYNYMGFGTAFTMSSLGFLIGRSTDELYNRTGELDLLNREVAAQKVNFEERFKILDSNIKSFHQISSRLQKSLDINEVLSLCSEGLHEILEYEQVNILLADETRSNLYFFSSVGVEGFDSTGVTLPLDSRTGIIFKSFSEKTPFLIDDIGKYPLDFRVQPPYDSIKPIRSKSFMLCPIVVKGESIGLFGIDNKFTKRSLNETDLDTIKLFADQVASAITRINLLAAIDTLTRELENTFTDLLRKRESYSHNLNNIIAAVNSMAESTRRISSASGGVMSSVDETSSAACEISTAIEQVSRNLDFLSEAVDKSISAMEQINGSLKNVEQNTTFSHDVSSRVKTEADKGMSVVEETISALDEIQKSVDLSYQCMKRLNENSSRIDSIVNVINAITKRTNLLALNASIIAAQAGEYGKSFGVVADEIRNLSLQTGQSTGEITGIIDEIMNESQIAANSVFTTKDLVQKGVGLGESTGKALQVILDSAQKAMEMTEQIKIATGEQTLSVRMVTRSVEDVGSMTAQISRASKEQTNATRSILSAIDSIKHITHQMADSTGRQAEDGAEIKRSLDGFGEMVTAFFNDLEERKELSELVMSELEVMKGKSS
jgi:methyl-accepting chemotaxis protein